MAAAAAPPAPPPASRTTLTFVAGATGAGRAASFDVDDASPMITSLVFLPWEIGAAGTPARVVRSALVGAIIMATRRPAQADLQRLCQRSILVSEVLASEISTVCHHLDVALAFDKVYKALEDWEEALPGILAEMPQPTLTLLRLTDAFFYDGVGVGRHTPSDILYLDKCSIGQLLRADISDDNYIASSLARAFILLGWKDIAEVRDDDSTDFRQSAERIQRLLARRMADTSSTASDTSYGREFCAVLSDLRLPLAFSKAAVTPTHAIEELTVTYSYWRGTVADARAIESSRFLGVPRQFPEVGRIVERFTFPGAAWTQIEMVAAALLPAAMSSVSMLARLSQLNTLLGGASWRATITHLINQDPTISGNDLGSAIIASHQDLASASAGAPSGSAGLGASVGAATPGASYGSVRDTSVADALRLDAASLALEDIQTMEGIERVETMMLSGSTLLMRAIFLQEAWLQNKASALSFCSLDEPYLCPYIAQTLTEAEDEYGATSVPDALLGFVYPSSELAILRSGKWASLNFINAPGGQLQIESMSTGANFSPVKDSERFTVEAVLDYMQQYGKRLFFAIGFSLSPQTGYSFTDLMELLRKALKFARTLPATESAEWLSFLHREMVEALNVAGELYLSKLKSARPERPEAVISEFLRPGCAFWINVNARLTRAKPMVNLRSAFPTIFSADPVPVPGTSAGAPPDKNKNKNKNKNTERGPGSKDVNKDGLTGPGCKSHFVKELSGNELFFCGTVVLVDKVKTHCAAVDGLCLPVVLSKKKGAEALELCPDAGNHGDMNADCHKRPSGLDINHVFKHCTRKATAAELKAANWAAPGKGKRAKP
jgi:hypothetical protein